MNNCFFGIFMKSTSSILNYVSVAASITMATPLHHNLKLYESTPRTGRTLFWVTTPLKHTPICGVGGGGGRNSGLLADNLCHSCSITLLPTALGHLS
jgi:hypothetical protein